MAAALQIPRRRADLSQQQQQKAANQLARTFTRLLRRKRADAAAARTEAASACVAGDDDYERSMDDAPTTIPSLSKLKLSGNLAAAYSLDAKDADLDRAKGSLAAELRAERAMEVRLHPGRTLASLDELPVSGLNPTHFLTALRHAVKSIRSFSKSMLTWMQAAGGISRLPRPPCIRACRCAGLGTPSSSSSPT